MREELELADFDVLDDDLEVLELDVLDFESETKWVLQSWRLKEYYVHLSLFDVELDLYTFAPLLKWRWEDEEDDFDDVDDEDELEDIFTWFAVVIEGVVISLTLLLAS